MSKQQNNLIDFDQADHDKQEVSNFKKQNRIETIRKYFYDLREKWNDKCYEQDCIYGNNHQDIKALSVKLTNFKIREGVKHLSIYSTKEVILDKDIKFNGGNFIVVAPIIKISSKINIDLSGENGISYGGTNIPKATDGIWNSSYNLHLPLYVVDLRVSYSNDKKFDYGLWNDNKRKSGADGTNGCDGTLGKNSGNLVMIAQNYIGLDNLRIDVSGGDGGHGQRGGDGGSCNTWYLTAPTKVAGGDGGNGGNAGKGAQPGYVQILQSKEDITSNYQNIIKQNDGKDGKPGDAGEGGVGWNPNRFYNFLKKIVLSTGQDGKKGKDGKLVEKDYFQNKTLLFSQIKEDYTKLSMLMEGIDWRNPKWSKAPEYAG